jgi:uncharacterized protein involved in outer membrane biogenesis
VVKPIRRRTALALGVVAAALVGVAAGEAAGWPFLAAPLERWLGSRLDRDVHIAGARGEPGFRLRLIGGLRVKTARLVLGSPRWSAAGAMLEADDAELALRYTDLLAWRGGGPLHVDRLAADRLAARIERRADGRASWQFGPKRDDDARPLLDGVAFGEVRVRDGRAVVADALLELALDMRFAWRDGADAGGTPDAGTPAGFQAQATGRYRGLPLSGQARTGAALAGADVPAQLRVTVGRAKLAFDGKLSDPWTSGRTLDGRYDVQGPSLAAVGAPLGLTLPTTPPFAMTGRLDGHAGRWHTVVESARIGASRLAGEFVFERPQRGVPHLSGTLTGSALRLADLGPAVGVPTPDVPAPRRAGRVLPAREFNLPSLRAMNADVQIRIARLETGSATLQDLRPLNAQLQLRDGVLEIGDIDARMAQGRLAGRIRLDGRREVAQWQADLTLRGMQLEQWLRDRETPYASGRIGARLNLTGQGRSTAQLLASADGRAVLHWTRGTISHRLVEAAGIDIAESLGVMLRGDRPLTVNCGAADLRIADGTATPRVMLVDTNDSVLALDGSLSLANERLDLELRARPKDFSVATLRSPVHIEGSFADPAVRVDRSGVLKRALPAALLAAINPLAAFLPLIDPGEDDDGQALAACRAASAQARQRTGG